MVGASDAAIVCSGTAALEAGLMLRPMIVVYRVSFLTGFIIRMLAHIAHVSLVNLLAGRALVPELLQRDCTPERIASAILTLLDDAGARQAQLDGLAQVRASLGAPGASGRAAEVVCALVRRIEAAPAAARTLDA